MTKDNGWHAHCDSDLARKSDRAIYTIRPPIKGPSGSLSVPEVSCLMCGASEKEGRRVVGCGPQHPDKR